MPGYGVTEFGAVGDEGFMYRRRNPINSPRTVNPDWSVKPSKALSPFPSLHVGCTHGVHLSSPCPRLRVLCLVPPPTPEYALLWTAYPV